MRFEVKTEDEVSNILPEGKYSFTVEEAIEKPSQRTGNDMIKLTLRIHGNNCEKVIFDYLLEAMHYKLRHFCEATNLLDKYDSGTLLPENCINKTGECLIVVDPGDDRFPRQNKVKDYVKKSSVSKSKGIGAPQESIVAISDTEFFSDPIPF